MTSQITDQLAATKLNDAPSEANWKEGLTAPAKDARPQTEVRTGDESWPSNFCCPHRKGSVRSTGVFDRFTFIRKLTFGRRM